MKNKEKLYFFRSQTAVRLRPEKHPVTYSFVKLEKHLNPEPNGQVTTVPKLVFEKIRKELFIYSNDTIWVVDKNTIRIVDERFNRNGRIILKEGEM